MEFVLLPDLLPGVKCTEVFTSYWQFATERQQVFLKRLRNEAPPWTLDEIIQQHRFTNVFRVSDRVSQYLIRNVIYQGSQEIEEVFFRIILFKLFNKIETWEYLLAKVGFPEWSKYDFHKYNDCLSKAKENKQPIYSAAYVMPSAESAFGYPLKHTNHLKLIEMMQQEQLPLKLSRAKSLKEVYELLLSYPSLGSFLVYQYAIDLNYSNLIDFDEDDFVVAGPGAKDGIQKCFASIEPYSYEDIIKAVKNKQNFSFNYLGLEPVTLFGRKLHLIDCQNLFCEISKYARVKHPHISSKTKRTRIKQKYSHNKNPLDFWLP